jgi:hypothetical protein
VKSVAAAPAHTVAEANWLRDRQVLGVKRILVIYYSQAGETARVARIFAEQLTSSGAVLDLEAIVCEPDYPYPWGSVRRFFDVMPQALLAEPPPIASPKFDLQTRFDVVVIVYPVWFLSPAPPVQAFFRSPHAAVLRAVPVITISVSRAMWQQASLTMKELLAAAGAVHCDNVVVTHQGSPLLTLVSTPRALLSGRRDRLMGVFPRSGVSDADLARIERLGAAVARQINADRPQAAPMLKGEPAVTVNRWFVVPELLGWYCFYRWALFIRRLSSIDPRLRGFGVYGFVVFLILVLCLGLPLAVFGTWLATPAIRGSLNRYVAKLAAPTGGATVPTQS